MNGYLTGNILKEEDGSQKLYAAFAFDGQYIPITMEYEGQRTIEETIVQALQLVYDKVHENQKKYYHLKDLDLHTDLLADNYRETKTVLYQSEPIMSKKRDIADTMFDGKFDYVNIDIDNLNITECREMILALSYQPDRFEGYRFRKDDFVICTSPERGPSSFDIFARVVEVDTEKNILVLDKYQEYGKVQWKPKAAPLQDAELGQYYRPASREEAVLVIENLKGLNKGNGHLEDRQMLKETLTKLERFVYERNPKTKIDMDIDR